MQKKMVMFSACITSYCKLTKPHSKALRPTTFHMKCSTKTFSPACKLLAFQTESRFCNSNGDLSTLHIITTNNLAACQIRCLVKPVLPHWFCGFIGWPFNLKQTAARK